MQAGPQRIHTTAAAAIVFMIMTHLLDTPCFAHVVQSDGEDEEPAEDTTLLEKCGILEGQPQQNTFEFDNGIVISSKFDSGNLKSCI